MRKNHVATQIYRERVSGVSPLILDCEMKGHIFSTHYMCVHFFHVSSVPPKERTLLPPSYDGRILILLGVFDALF